MLLNKLKKNKTIITVGVIIAVFLAYYYFYNNQDTSLEIENELVLLDKSETDKSENVVNKNEYIENKIIDSSLKLQPAKRTKQESNITEKLKEYIKKFKDYVNKDKKSLKKCLKKKPFLKSPDRYHNNKDVNDCFRKSIRRCNVSPENSTRCFLNECDLSSYNQCTNNVMSNQNSCDCRGRELCKLNNKSLKDCYKQTLKDCKKKVKFNV